jgi:hypothetical protein
METNGTEESEIELMQKTKHVEELKIELMQQTKRLEEFEAVGHILEEWKTRPPDLEEMKTVVRKMEELNSPGLEELKTVVRNMEERETVVRKVEGLQTRIDDLEEVNRSIDRRLIWERVYATLGGGSFIMLIELLFNVSKENRNFWTELSLCSFAIALPVNVAMYLLYTPGIYKLYSLHEHERSLKICHFVGFCFAFGLPLMGLNFAITSVSWIASLVFGVATWSLVILTRFIYKAMNHLTKEFNRIEDEAKTLTGSTRA